MLMQEVDVPETKDLIASTIVPRGKTIKVHACANALCDVSKQSAHEREVVGVHGDESRNIVFVLVLKIR